MTGGINMERTMYDVQTLREIRKRADEISYYCMGKNRLQNPQNIIVALDQVCRALAMFAETEIQKMKNENISYDPQSYIKGRLGIAYRTIHQDPQGDSHTA
jgi:hypothetical protein